ncbi:hypothetical protein GCM10011505_38590 [Tistrella bauzanensis]|uniref:Uncharacterized protein n=1 Tax=Tistrella bauzanensis TaxID=657419 RepID=A0ABQ1IXT5_9PROT|nr:hypothetical protein [Tistrella bauzanensis]GGB53857.1 hypothetical protein GCM10011505_38590 [Tistrella bauzanensis]
MSKHPKTERPSDADLRGNPMIGGSRGTTRAGVDANDLAQDQGRNTMEGDVGNDTTPQGGISKSPQADRTTRR